MRTRAPALVLAGLILAASSLLPGLSWIQGVAAQPAADPQAIGKFLSLTGSVLVEHTGPVVLQANAPAGGNRQAKVGDVVFRGDVILTGADGTAGLVFSDGTSFSIYSNARMELNEFVYDPKSNANSTLLNLKKGAFTFIAGAIAKSGDMKIETPVGTMGIRGTAPHVEVADDGTVKFTTLVEENKRRAGQGTSPGAAPGQRGALNPSSRIASAAPQGRSAIQDVEQCNGSQPTPADAQIAACTALIEAQLERPQSLAIAHNNRGIARARTGEYDLAIQDYDESIRLNPQYARAYNNRGMAYVRKGDQTRAIRDFSAAIGITPDYVSALANRGQAYEKMRSYDLALADFNEAIRIQPALGILWNERCWIRAITGVLQEALTDCNEAIRLGPDSAAKFDSRGLAYLKLGQFASAIADFNAALRLNPQLASSLYGRGLARQRSGDAAAGQADIVTATQAKQNIAEDYASYGVR